MNYSDYRFTLDIQIHQAQVSVPVTLNDTARKLYIGLTDGRKPYTINDGCRAVFAAKKPDGTTILNDCIIEKNTTIVYEFSKNTTSAEGIVNCEVRLFDAEGKELTSPQFLIVVDAKVVRDEEVSISESESTTIGNIVVTELGRVASENERAEAESARVIAEESRAENEITRGDAETSRIIAEEGRADAENLRVEAENERADAENSRADAEALRVKADGERGEFLGDLDGAINEILEIQEEILNGNAELIAKEEVIKAINETLLIADDLETDDPYKALSAAQGVVLKGMLTNVTKIEGGYYNGTGTTVALTFSFVPKLIFITGRIGVPNANNKGQVDVSSEQGFVLLKEGDVNGTTAVFSGYNKMSYYHPKTDYGWLTEKIPYTEADGYGYWYYGIG